DAAVRGIAAAEEHRRLRPLEASQLLLQLMLREEISADEPARPRPGAPFPRPGRERLGNARIPRKAEVVVGAEVDQPLPVPELHLRPRPRPQRLQLPQEPPLPQPLQLLFRHLIDHRNSGTQYAIPHAKWPGSEPVGTVNCVSCPRINE